MCTYFYFLLLFVCGLGLAGDENRNVRKSVQVCGSGACGPRCAGVKGRQHSEHSNLASSQSLKTDRKSKVMKRPRGAKSLSLPSCLSTVTCSHQWGLMRVYIEKSEMLGDWVQVSSPTSDVVSAQDMVPTAPREERGMDYSARGRGLGASGGQTKEGFVRPSWQQINPDYRTDWVGKEE